MPLIRRTFRASLLARAASALAFFFLALAAPLHAQPMEGTRGPTSAPTSTP
jgi:hypothetical protein